MRSFIVRRGSSTSIVSTEECLMEKTKTVMRSVRRKGPPLTTKQAEFCDEACIGRFLKAKGNNVKKAAKQLRATLTWRANLDVDYLTADEFTAELAVGSAFVAGHDEEDRPVVIVRLKPESLTGQAQKQFLRYFVFTMEVAIACMSAPVQQLVLILDASCMKRSSSPSAGLSVVAQLLKVLGEHYPERLSRAFIVDAPSMFNLFWKGIGKFVDLKMTEKLRFVFSRNYYSNLSSTASSVSSAASHLFKAAARTPSNRSFWSIAGDDNLPISDEDEDEIKTQPKFDIKTPRKSVSTSSTSSFSSSSSTSSNTSSSLSNSISSYNIGPALPTDRNQARSLSFAISTPALIGRKEGSIEFRSFRVDTKPCRRQQEDSSSRRWTDIFTSGRDHELSGNQHQCYNLNQKDKNVALFRPYYNAFFVSPYNEASYRALMKPPLAGLISIISPELKFRQPSFCLSNTATVEAVLHHLQL